MNLHHWMVFDVESIGLFGAGFAVAYVILRPDLSEAFNARYVAPPASAPGTPTDHHWVQTHVPLNSLTPTHDHPHALRGRFWSDYERWLDDYPDLLLAADVPWPVESRFLLDCLRDHPYNAARAPYPLIDVASVPLAAGLDPTATVDRLPGELPAHDPLADARQSARLLREALALLHPTP